MTSFDVVQSRFGRTATHSARDTVPVEDRTVAAQRLTVLIGCFSLLAMLALWVATLLSNAGAPARCSATPVRPAFGAETIAAMTAAPGNPCIVFLQPTAGPLEELAVATPPSHGIVAVRGRTGVTYRAEARYRGEDAFVLRLRNREGGVATVRVRVEVR